MTMFWNFVGHCVLTAFVGRLADWLVAHLRTDPDFSTPVSRTKALSLDHAGQFKQAGPARALRIEHREPRRPTRVVKYVFLGKQARRSSTDSCPTNSSLGSYHRCHDGHFAARCACTTRRCIWSFDKSSSCFDNDKNTCSVCLALVRRAHPFCL